MFNSFSIPASSVDEPAFDGFYELLFKNDEWFLTQTMLK